MQSDGVDLSDQQNDTSEEKPKGERGWRVAEDIAQQESDDGEDSGGCDFTPCSMGEVQVEQRFREIRGEEALAHDGCSEQRRAHSGGRRSPWPERSESRDEDHADERNLRRPDGEKIVGNFMPQEELILTNGIEDEGQ